jgi:hypothetical protein
MDNCCIAAILGIGFHLAFSPYKAEVIEVSLLRSTAD